MKRMVVFTENEWNAFKYDLKAGVTSAFKSKYAPKTVTDIYERMDRIIEDSISSSSMEGQ